MNDPSYYLNLKLQFGAERALDVAIEDLLKAGREREATQQVFAGYSAIARLPRPPAEIGDGPDERVGWALTLLEDLCDAVNSFRTASIPPWRKRHGGESSGAADPLSVKDTLEELFRIAGECAEAIANSRAALSHRVPIVELRPGKTINVGEHVIRNNGDQLETSLPTADLVSDQPIRFPAQPGAK
ncbi:MAG TPA: hypothetical protein VJG32_17810 [Anaerolineae bacterium]|nr:hypothetical protein [Anaerolineae bacterium]